MTLTPLEGFFYFVDGEFWQIESPFLFRVIEGETPPSPQEKKWKL